MSDPFGNIAVILGLTVVNGFFSGAEIALLSVRTSRLRELADQGDRGAQKALELRRDPERLLATVQVGITVVGATAGAFGGAVFEAPLTALLLEVGAGRAARGLALAVVVAGLSTLNVVVGELVPKSLALRAADRGARLASRPLSALSRIARPVVWALSGLSNLLLRPFHDHTTFVESRVSPGEIQELVEEATAAGTVGKDAGEIASRAIDMSSLRIYSIMLPRGEVAWMPVDAAADDVLRILRDRPHARYPVLETDGLHPAGYVVARELYLQLLERTALNIRGSLREVPVLSDQTSAVDALRILQRARTEIGIVVDETGAPAGLVSIELLAEELFGEIAAEQERVLPGIRTERSGSYVVRGATPVHDVNRELGVDLPIAPGVVTLSGLCVARHGGFPEVGTRIELAAGLTADVLEASPRRVLLVRLTRAGSPPIDGDVDSSARTSR